jgi:hypothetical protein
MKSTPDKTKENNNPLIEYPFSQLPTQQQQNSTGLAENLQAGIENLSGYTMDTVKVHYNSGKPDQLKAHAYPQGTANPITSHENHLPHETWHIVQQKQGRVKPTLQMRGEVILNDNEQLEKEADIMGRSSLNLNTTKVDDAKKPVLNAKTYVIPSMLLETKTLVFDPGSFELTNAVAEKESTDYGACQFELNALKIVFRVAKITATKVGQFVTVWKRIAKGPIAPFEVSDAIDLLLVNTKSGDNFGQFVFPKSVLIQQGILSTDLKEGKRAIRVYPPWDITTSKQAQQTQKWQLDYFLEIPLDKPIDLKQVKLLYAQEIK